MPGRHQLDTSSGLTMAEQIAWAVRHRIQTGALAPGDRIPSGDDLAAHWGVSQDTALRALRLLKGWGLTRARLGYGTYVRGPGGDG